MSDSIQTHSTPDPDVPPKPPPLPDDVPPPVHAPVPTAGALPARVTCVKPQVAAPVWSGPAVAGVGF